MPYKIALIGVGAVGQSLELALASAGHQVTPITKNDLHLLIDLSVDLVLCCVPDDILPALDFRLAGLKASWKNTIIGHVSGATESTVFKDVKSAGGQVMSFHPMQTFVRGKQASLNGIYIAIEGDDEAVSAGMNIAESLQAIGVKLPAGAKVKYHLAAAIASNFSVTIMDVALEVFRSAGIPDEISVPMITPLMQTTWSNILTETPTNALTGPIVRGDTKTIGHHIDALESDLPHLLNLYQTLGSCTIDLAQKSGRLSSKDAETLSVALKTTFKTSRNK